MRFQLTYKRKAQPGDPLTAREEEVLWLMAEGLSNKLIADRIGVTEHTAKFHVTNCCVKMGASTRTEAAVRFVLDQPLAEARSKLSKSPQLTLVA